MTSKMSFFSKPHNSKLTKWVDSIERTVATSANIVQPITHTVGILCMSATNALHTSAISLFNSAGFIALLGTKRFCSYFNFFIVKRCANRDVTF